VRHTKLTEVHFNPGTVLAAVAVVLRPATLPPNLKIQWVKVR